MGTGRLPRHARREPRAQRRGRVARTARLARATHAARAVRVFMVVLLAAVSVAAPNGCAFAAEEQTVGTVTVSADATGAVKEKCEFGIADFYRAQVGSNRTVDGEYLGYAYYVAKGADQAIAIFSEEDAVVYLPPAQAQAVEFSAKNSTQTENLAYLLTAMNEANANGGVTLDKDSLAWHFTTETSFAHDGIVYSFDVADASGKAYATVRGADGQDVTKSDASPSVALKYCNTFDLLPREQVTVVNQATGFAAIAEFFGKIDYSPLLVTLKTTCTAIVFIFILGLLAAYWLVRLPSRAQDIFDAVFTIPMVLPPTVCGFLLLLLLGRNTPVGRWFIDIGFPLIFSWQATVIAAIVVSFPLMYRSARGAFENLDENMLDAARTLGWSNRKVFFRLMLPLSWPSIAAGTVLSFARALGEFGATLFLAGNYAGITQTIPIAIYFQWMNGNTDVALFWTAVVILFSFVVIVFINLWSKRTTRYKRPAEDEPKGRKRRRADGAGDAGGADGAARADGAAGMGGAATPAP